MNRGLIGGNVLLSLAAMACYPASTRPRTVPLPEANLLEVALLVPAATRNLAVALDADSIPVSRTEPQDGWLETDWFDATSWRPTSQRPLGAGVVKLRAWVDPSKPQHSCITMEVVYRPTADPSRDGRLLEREVSDSHPVAKRVAATMRKVQAQYGAKDPTASCSRAPSVRDSVAAKDSTKAGGPLR